MKNYTAIVAQNMRERRRSIGLTQTELGKLIGYSEKSVSKWESGQALPPSAVLPLLASCLRTSIDELMTETANIQYYLGIDGGGTKTEFVLTDADGRVLEQVILGGSNPTDVGLNVTCEVLESGIRRVCRTIPPHQISVFAGLAGGISGNHREQIRAFLESYAFGAADNGSDGENAVAAGLGAKDGIVVILGTGVIAFSQQGGVSRRFGGYGHFFGDPGSGFSIGRDGVLAALQEEDGSGEATLITSLVLKKCATEHVIDSLSHFYQNGKKTLASYAPLVFEAYAAGDGVAAAILQKHVEGVASLIRNTGKRFGDALCIPVVLCGGLTAYRDILLPKICASLDDARFCVRVCNESMVQGALFRAGLQAEQKA